MGALLEQARRVFGGKGADPPPPDPFEVACLCGKKLSGTRQDYRQFIPCPGCGELLFVLPSSPYPPPKPKETSAARREGEEVPGRSADALAKRLREGSFRARDGVTRGLLALVPPRRWFSTGRLVGYGMVLIVVATAASATYLTRRSQLPGEVLAARSIWTEAIEKGELTQARTELERAAAALRRYGSRDRQAKEIQHLAREVALYTDQLEEPIAQLFRTAQSMPAHEWAELFRGAYRGRSVLFDVHVRPVEEDDGSGSSYHIDYALFLDAEPNATEAEPGRWDFRDFELFNALGLIETRRVIFGARLESIRPLPGSANAWEVRLDPGSGVLLTSATCLEKLGWPLDPATREFLEEQLRWTLEQP